MYSYLAFFFHNACFESTGSLGWDYYKALLLLETQRPANLFFAVGWLMGCGSSRAQGRVSQGLCEPEQQYIQEFMIREFMFIISIVSSRFLVF